VFACSAGVVRSGLHPLVRNDVRTGLARVGVRSSLIGRGTRSACDGAVRTSWHGLARDRQTRRTATARWQISSQHRTVVEGYFSCTLSSAHCSPLGARWCHRHRRACLTSSDLHTLQQPNSSNWAEAPSGPISMRLIPPALKPRRDVLSRTLPLTNVSYYSVAPAIDALQASRASS
jgi:hypothetical protein